MADVNKIQIDLSEYDIVSKGMPSGGASGYVLKKASASDYDTEWAEEDIGSVFPEGGTTGQVLAKKSNATDDVEWKDNTSLPTGGAAGFALVKNSSTNYDVKWARTSLLIHVTENQ